MTDQLVVAYMVVTIYLVVATMLALIYGLAFYFINKMAQKSDREAALITEALKAAAGVHGTSVWGLAVMAGLRWPLALINTIRK